MDIYIKVLLDIRLNKPQALVIDTIQAAVYYTLIQRKQTDA